MAPGTRSRHPAPFASNTLARTARELFAEAVGHQVAGRASEAELAYRQALAVQPTFAEAENNLGVLLRPTDEDAAHALFEHAVLARPDYTEALFNLALSWNKRGDLDEAIACYRRVLDVDPNHVRALNDLGSALRAAGNLDDALVVSRRAAEICPSDPAILSNLGNVLLQRGHLEEAVASYQKALAIDPDYPEALNNLGGAYRGLRQPEKALPLFLRALELRPGYLDAMHNLGLGLPAGLPGSELIEPLLRAEVARMPDDAAPLAVLAVFLQEAGRFDESAVLADEVLRRDDNSVDGWTVRGICAAEAGDPREAIRCYERALTIQPGYAVARWNRALALLSVGEYTEGWREYESRWELLHMALDRRLVDRPEWDGSSLDGRTILVYTEQGLGDAIQFARFGAELKKRWKTRIIVECDGSLLTLFRNCSWVDGVVGRGVARPAFDTHVSLLSLPRILGMTLENLPSEPAFPSVDRPAAQRIMKRPGTLNVGIVWGGRAPNPALARRSVPLELLEPLAGIPGIRLHSLQIGDTTGQLERCSFGGSINDVAPHIADFVDTAAVMAQLDLVITIDTSVAHLAGALGVPVWVMLIKNADWRWMHDRRDSPWYPSARLFRQRTAGDWSPVVEEITGALRVIAATDSIEPRLVHLDRPDAAPIAELAARQRHADGAPRFTVAVPLASLNDSSAFASYAAELAGNGIDYEARTFFDNAIGADDVVIDIAGGWGFTALGAATAPTPPALVVAVVSNTDDAAVVAAAARTARTIGPLRVHVHGDAGEAGVDELLTRYAPNAERVIVRVHAVGEVPTTLAAAANALTNGRVAGIVWTMANAGASSAPLFSETLAMEAMSSLGFEHFVMTEDAAGPLLSPLNDASVSRTVFSLLAAGAQSLVAQPPARKAADVVSISNGAGNCAPVLGFDWQVGASSGWGVYGLNLARRAIASGAAMPAPLLAPALDGVDATTRLLLAPMLVASAEFAAVAAANPGKPLRVPFLMLRALGNGLHAGPHSASISAPHNVGVVFFESTDLDAAAIDRARRFDRIIAGSTWNADVLRSHGIDNVVTVLQGVDATTFKPRAVKPRRRGEFIVFSGGKLEYRKGQDIVVAAFREFHRRHPESKLMVAWHNHWPRTMGEIGLGGHTTGVPMMDRSGRPDFTAWLASNGIPAKAVIDLGLRGNSQMAELLGQADVALFTNRAEGGTNLVAMECLASAVPTILSANTGHLDLIDDARCYALRSQGTSRPSPSFPGTNGWGESSVEEAVEALERAYADPADAAARAANAAEWMRDLNWNSQIDRLMGAIQDLF